ncbi:MAG TPA: DUF4974 domain-containing protein [Sphingobacterium sp.]|nr:DUF4974 domain-containing protein [Sphingobacterium sp.]
MDENKIQEILSRYQEGKCSDEEKAWIESWYLQLIDDSDKENPDSSDMNRAKRKIWHAISSERPAVKPQRYLYRKIVAAASILLAFGIAFYSLHDNTATVQQNVVSSQETVKPGGNNAYLTLAGGERINLSDVEDGMLSEQAGIKILKKSNGELVYEISDSPALHEGYIGTNIIETPIGGQYQVLLPDGTKVWLNSSSSLEYPIQFTHRERKVALTGEAYFEVNTDNDRPFRVVSAAQMVEVLGTKFNINTYDDEPVVRTTLLEGSVRVSSEQDSKILRPGEQAAVTGQNIKVKIVDTEQFIGWYKGDFVFDGAELRNIMRQISRWYGVDVIYQNDIGNIKFGGSISRSKDIQEVLKVLSMTKGVNFKLEGRRVLVMQ